MQLCCVGLAGSDQQAGMHARFFCAARLCCMRARAAQSGAHSRTPWLAGILSLVSLKACPRSAQRFKGSCWT
eukprot:COSAG02_NODE_2387_length_8986_cov_12.395184_7_plen_72_part_00